MSSEQVQALQPACGIDRGYKPPAHSSQPSFEYLASSPARPVRDAVNTDSQADAPQVYKPRGGIPGSASLNQLSRLQNLGHCSERPRTPERKISSLESYAFSPEAWSAPGDQDGRASDRGSQHVTPVKKPLFGSVESRQDPFVAPVIPQEYRSYPGSQAGTPQRGAPRQYLVQSPSHHVHHGRHVSTTSLHSIPEGWSLVPAGAFIHRIPAEVKQARSDQLNALTNTPTALPSIETALSEEYFPFVEGGKQAKAINHGCVKIRNIPFATKRSEVVAFFGRNSRILNDVDEPVHIIMERVTSKTMDAYVEFVKLDDAMRAVERFHNNQRQGKFARLGDRFVEIELASQAALMKDLFPFAAGVTWSGATPTIMPFRHEYTWENFKGFIFEEEMIMLVKHVEVPHRSPFSRDCPQRPYECLISTINKFPWNMTHCITVSQRRAMFQATIDLIQLLQKSIEKKTDLTTLNEQLLRRLVRVAMRCPGFTPLMKDDISYLAAMPEAEQQEFGQPRFANSWCHQWAIVPKSNMPRDVIEWYIALIREQSQRDLLARPMIERHEIQAMSADTDMYWGFFWKELGYEQGTQFDQMTLARAADVELTAIERILRRVCSAT